MKVEDQCVSLELSKKLEELGVKQESLFDWALCTKTEKYKVIGTPGNHKLNKGFTAYYCMGRDGRDGKGAFYSAFTVAELWEFMPYGTQLNKCLAFGNPLVEYGNNINKKSINKMSTRREGQKVVDALAKMLIYLIENNLIKIWEK